MAEELGKPIEEVVTTPEVAVEVPAVEVQSEALPEVAYSEEEQLAMGKGWKPDFEGATKVDAGEFLRREELFGKIADLNRKHRDTEKLLKETIEHNRRLAEASKVKELNELAAKRKEAVAIGDEEAFEAADKEYMKKAAEPAMPAQQGPAELSDSDKKEFTTFKERNPWANTDSPENKRMLMAADQIFELLREELPGKSTADYLKLTEDRVKGLFSHRFVNPRRDAPQTVGTGQRITTKPSGLPSYDSLNSVQKHQCDLYVRSGGKKEEYIQQLKDLGRV